MPAESPGLMGCRGEYLLREEFRDLESDLGSRVISIIIIIITSAAPGAGSEGGQVGVPAPPVLSPAGAGQGRGLPLRRGGGRAGRRVQLRQLRHHLHTHT